VIYFLCKEENIIFLLKKSIYLISYFIVISIFGCLSFSALASSFNQTENLSNGLNQDSLGLVVYSPYNETDILIEDLLTTLETSEDTSYLVYKDDGTNYGKKVYLHNKEFPLISDLEKETFKGLDCAVIDNLLISNIIQENNKEYFLYNGKKYEVLGKFKGEMKNLNPDSLFFVSLNTQESLLGNYSIDGLSVNIISSTLEELKKIDSNLEFELYSLYPTLPDRILLTIQDQLLIIILMVIVLILISINTIDNTLLWYDSRKEEIYARYLVGATNKNLHFWLIAEYLYIITGSFICGTIIAYLAWRTKILVYIVPSFNVIGIIFTFILCFLIGMATVFIIITNKGRNKSIVKKEMI